jgi:outer membrane protein assembly factor BamB
MIIPLLARLESGFIFGMLPSLFTVGPLALLAWLFPATFGALALFVRRRIVLFTVLGSTSSLYLLQATLRNSLAGTGWSTPAAFWSMAAAIAGGGLLWTCLREPTPRLEVDAIAGQSAVILLGISSFLCLGIAAGCLLSDYGRAWRDLLPFCTAVWIGLGTSLWVRRAGTASVWPAQALAVERAMLTTLILTSGLAALLSLPARSPATMRVVWAFEPVERGAIVSTPLVAGQRIYVGTIRDGADRSRGAVYAIDRNTGKATWRFDDDGRMLNMFSTPCLDGNRLYIGEGMHADFACKLYCLDAASGHKLWEFGAGNHIESSPTFANSKVYVGAGDDGLYCLDGNSGARVWNYRADVHIDASPVVVGDCVYASSGLSRRYRDTAIFCLDAASGQVRWRKQTDLPGWGSPLVLDRRVYFGLGNGRLLTSVAAPEKPAGALLCVDADTGETIFRFAAGDAVLDRPATASSHVYFNSRDGFLYALDCQSGVLKWRFDLGGPAVTSPAVAGKVVYVVPIRGPLVCVDAANGHLVASFDLEKWNGTEVRLLSSPVIASDPTGEGGRDTVYFGAEVRGPLGSSAVLYALQSSP